MMIMSLLALILPLILIILNSVLGKKSLQEREKPSPFECGFDPKSSARIPFSLRFYLVALIFLIFDVEITLILPIPLLNNYTSNFTMLSMTSLYFLLILLLGLFHEWNEGALQWDL